jgi:hypothetical protein
MDMVVSLGNEIDSFKACIAVIKSHVHHSRGKESLLVLSLLERQGKRHSHAADLAVNHV